MSQTFTDHLQRRLTRSGASPLITYYDESTGERTELSATSFANWVDKTANLLVDEVLIEPGQPVALRLARQHPAHWVTLVWVAACWRVGCPVLIGPGHGEQADAAGTVADPSGQDRETPAVEVVGPAEADTPSTIERIACSLHPLGLGFTDPLPEGTVDYGLEVRGQPDRYTGPVPDPDTSAWAERDLELSQREITHRCEGDPGQRRMVLPRNDRVWPDVEDALARPVVTGGSSVIVLGADADRVASIRSAERAEPADPSAP